MTVRSKGIAAAFVLMAFMGPSAAADEPEYVRIVVYCDESGVAYDCGGGASNRNGSCYPVVVQEVLFCLYTEGGIGAGIAIWVNEGWCGVGETCWGVYGDNVSVQPSDQCTGVVVETPQGFIIDDKSIRLFCLI